MTVRRLYSFLLLMLGIAIFASCRASDPEVIFYSVDGHRFSKSERRAIERIARATVAEVRRLLPSLSTELILRVEAGKDVIPETGETGSAHPPGVVYWTVDPSRPGGVGAIVNAELRPTLFHELHHLVRETTVGEARTIVDQAVSEGMATVFERDFTGAPAPWGKYPENVEAWLAELQALPPGAPRREWMFQHPDGRRWIGFKVGAYLVDHAIRASGQSAATLVSTSTDEIVRLALTPKAQ